jgi:hypothetical protein
MEAGMYCSSRLPEVHVVKLPFTACWLKNFENVLVKASQHTVYNKTLKIKQSDLLRTLAFYKSKSKREEYHDQNVREFKIKTYTLNFVCT